MITDVSPDSPASKAKIERGDVILAINGRPVASWEELRLLIAGTMPGATIRLSISRDGKPLTLEATLAKIEDKPDELISGVEVTALTDELRARLRIPARYDGLLVKDVNKDSPYADVLAPEFLIVQIDREYVTDLASAKAAMTPGRHLLYVYYRGALRVARIEVK